MRPRRSRRRALRRQGRVAALSVQHLRDALARHQAANPTSAETAEARLHLADGLVDVGGDGGEAVDEARRALDDINRSHGADHPRVGAARRVLGLALVVAGEPEEAEMELDAAAHFLTAYVARPGAQPRLVIEHRLAVAALCDLRGEVAPATALLAHSSGAGERALRVALATVHVRNGDAAAARTVLQPLVAHELAALSAFVTQEPSNTATPSMWSRRERARFEALASRLGLTLPPPDAWVRVPPNGPVLSLRAGAVVVGVVVALIFLVALLAQAIGC